MMFARVFGFSRASRIVLFCLLPFFLIAVGGSVLTYFSGADANPTGKFLLLMLSNIVIASSVTGLLLGLIGGIKGDEDASAGRFCALAHGVVLLVALGGSVLLFL